MKKNCLTYVFCGSVFLSPFSVFAQSPCNNPALTLNGGRSSTGQDLQYTRETDDGVILSDQNTLNATAGVPEIETLTVSPEIAIGGCAKTATASVTPSSKADWITPTQQLGSAPTSTTTSAHCPITVSLGDDYYYCDPPPPVQLNGQIDGPYFDFKWTPTNPLTNPYILDPEAWFINQTTAFVLTVRSVEPSLNLLVNPDFEQGNVGFTSDLMFSPGNIVPIGTYDILANPQSANDAYEPCGDHTSGSGNMFATNLPSPYLALWCQTVPVTPNTDYYYSFWSTTLDVPNVTNRLGYYINGLGVGAPQPNTEPCKWVQEDGMWNSGSSTSATICIRKIKSGNYSAAIDDLFFGPACTVKDTVMVFVQDVKAVASPSSYIIPCDGIETTLSGSGSTVGANIIYNWDTSDGNIVSGQNTLQPVVNAPGTYTLTVSSENGAGDCSSTTTVEVELADQIQVSITAPQTMSCNNPLTLLKAFSTQPAFSIYQWTAGSGGNIFSGANSATAVIDQPGDYTVTVTNTATGCTAEASVSVAASSLPTANAAASPITCAASQAPLSGAGSSTGPNFTYSWTTTNGHIVSGQNSINALADTAGVYVLLVSNTTNNCSKTDTVHVTANTSALPVTVLAADTITCIQNTVMLSTDSATAGAHRTYQWTAHSGGNIVSGGDSLSPLVNAPGLYVIVVTDTLNACTGVDTVAVIADNDAVIAIANAPASLNCIHAIVSLDATGSSAGPQPTYQWSTSDGHIVSGGDTPSPTVDAPGVYSLLLTNPANGCTATDLAEVIQNTAAPEVSFSPATPLSCAQPLLTLQGQNTSPAGSYFYDWTASDGGHIFAGDSTLMLCVDAGGTYTLLATNLDNGCTSTTSIQVTEDFNVPDVVLLVPEVLNCHAGSVALLNTGTTDPSLLDHEWTLPDGSSVNTGVSPNLNATVPGLYSLLVSNTQNGCTASAAVTVVQHDNVTVALGAQQNNACFGAFDGALDVTAGGGNGAYTYQWSNNASTPSIAGLAAGAYTVIVTDAENCTATLSVAVTEPAQLSANASATPPSANGASDGTVTADPQGGTAPYTFAWDNGSDAPVVTGLPAGFYTVTVTDVNGCTAVQTVEVWSGDCAVSATLQAVDPLCHGAADGQATVLPLGGSAPYTYLWTTGSTEQTATNLAAGTYGVTLTDANDCPFSGSVSLGEPSMLTLEVQDVVDAVCPNSSEGSVTVLAGGGTGSSEIVWSNGQSGPVATGLPAGDYVATATDANGCTATTSATVQALDQEPPVIVAGPVSIPLGPSGSMELTLQNLDALVTDNCGTATIQIMPDEFDCFDLGAQQVTITAQDESGNSSTQTITVTFVDIEIPVLECPAGITRCATENQVEYAAPVAIDNCLILGGTFNLVTGLPSGSPFPQGTTTNTYTYTDASGNTGTCDFQVTILSPLAVGLDAILHDVGDQHIGGVQVSVAGSQPGYAYEWVQNGLVIATTEDLSGVGMGIYSLWVTDAAGCKTEAGPFEVSNLVGTGNPEWADYIAVYPNPSSGRVFVLLPDELVNAEVDFEVFDVLGRRVLEQRSIRDKRVELDLSNLAAGLYSVLIRVEQGQVVRKIVVNR